MFIMLIIYKYLFLVLIVITCVVAFPTTENEDDCNIFCTFIYEPVCGTDGKGNNKVFSSPCMMRRQSCLEGKG